MDNEEEILTNGEEQLSPQVKKWIEEELDLDPKTASKEELKSAQELWDSLSYEERTEFTKGTLEGLKTEEEKEREFEGQTERYRDYIETGHDPLELKRLEERQKKEEEEKTYGKLISKAQTLGIPASKIPPKEDMDVLEILVRNEEKKRKLGEQTAKEQLSKERWKKRAAVGVAVGAGLHTAGYLFKGAKKAVVPPRAGSEKIRDTYFGRPSTGLYSAPGLRMYPGRPQTAQPQVVHKPWGSPFGQLMTQPGVKPGFKSPLAEMVWPIRQTRPTPTTPTLSRPTLGQETPTRDLQSYMAKKGYEPISSLRGLPAYFWIGTKQGSEPSSNAWVVRLQTGRYGLAGIGDKTGRPRSKISWASPEEAFDAASDIPGR